MPSKAKTPESLCEKCNASFPPMAVTFAGAQVLKKRFCDACCSVMELEYQNLVTGKALDPFEERWAKLCPPLYAQPFNILRIIKDHPGSEKAIREAVQKVQQWRYNPRGVGLVGISGKGKTRIIFTLLRTLLAEGRSCEYVNLSTFGREVGARFSESASKANDWIKRLCRCDVLFLDDVGKEKMTERVEVELYGIVESRSSYLLPILFTANSKGERLMEKMRDESGEISDRALPIVRRLREFSEGIVI